MLFDASTSLTVRPRRLRKSAVIRSLVAETQVLPQQLIQPYFLLPGQNQELAIKSMPGITKQSLNIFLQHLEKDVESGIRAIESVKCFYGDDVCVISDVCLCAYTE